MRIVMGQYTDVHCLLAAHFYRHEAQKCYCGEPNCIGFIGGKTQTDIGGMDDLYIDGNYRSFPCRSPSLLRNLFSPWYSG